MLTIYADGSCSPNPGTAGIGFVIYNSETPDRHTEGSRCLGEGTNNIAELEAVREALHYASAVYGYDVEISLHTDSSYAIGIFSKNWKAKANQDLIASIKPLIAKFTNLKFVYVKGHSGEPGNELADTLAQNSRTITNLRSTLGVREHISSPNEEVIAEVASEMPVPKEFLKSETVKDAQLLSAIEQFTREPVEEYDELTCKDGVINGRFSGSGQDLMSLIKASQMNPGKTIVHRSLKKK